MHKLSIVLEEVKALRDKIKKKDLQLKESFCALESDLQSKSELASAGGPFDFPVESFEQIMHLVEEVKSKSFTTSFMIFINNLLNLNLLSKSMNRKILKYLTYVWGIADEMQQKKVQQLLFLISSPSTIDLSDISFLERVFSLLCLMRVSKDAQISNSAKTSLFQTISSLLTQAFTQTPQIQLKASEQLQPEQEKGSETNSQIPDRNSDTANQLQIEKIRSLAQILYDFVMIAEEQPCEWWPKSIPIDKDLGYQCLFQALVQLGDDISKFKEVENIFRFNLFQLAIKGLSSAAISNIQMLNFIRGISRGVIYLRDEFDALGSLVGLSLQNELNQSSFWSFEGIIYVISNSDVLYALISCCNSKNYSDSALGQIINSAVILTKKICNFSISSSNSSQTINNSNGLSTNSTSNSNNNFISSLGPRSQTQITLQPKTLRAIEHLDNDIEFPNFISINLILRQQIDFFAKLASSLEMICTNPQQLNIEVGKKVLVDLTETQELFKAILELLWKDVYSSLKLLFTQKLEESQFESVLSTLQTLLTIFSTLKINHPTQQFLKAITRYAVQQDSDITAQYIQTNKVLLNIAHCLGSLMEVNSWLQILSFCEKSEKLYNKNRIARGNSQDELSKQSDIQILQTTLDNLFLNSASYESSHLIVLINSLFELLVDTISQEKSPSNSSQQFNIASNPKKPEQQQSAASSPNIAKNKQQTVFPLAKILQTLKVNLYRIDLIWESISANFLALSTTRNTFFREQAVETLGQLVLDCFQFLQDEYSGNDSIVSGVSNKRVIPYKCSFKDKSKWSKDEWQHTLFQPWIDIQCHCESRDIIMGNILKILQNNGHVINRKGWSQILDILKGISSESTQTFIFNGKIERKKRGIKLIWMCDLFRNIKGMKCIELLVNQYLNNLHYSKLNDLLSIIDSFKKYSNDNNINYLSCDMLWHIGDHLAKNYADANSTDSGIPRNQFSLLATTIFQALLAVCGDQHAEARNSAQHIFTSLLVHNFAKLEWGISLEILTKNAWEMSDRILSGLKREIREGQPDRVKSWEESASNVTQNTAKIAKRYLQILELKYSQNSEVKQKELDQQQQDQQVQPEQSNNQESIQEKQQESSQDSPPKQQSSNNDSQEKLTPEQSQSLLQDQILVIDRCLQILLKFMSINLNELSRDALKAVREVLNFKPFITLSCHDTVSKTISQLSGHFATVPTDPKAIKSSFSLLQPETLAFLSDLFHLKLASHDEERALEQHIGSAFELMYLLLTYSKFIGESIDMQVNRIYPDDKVPFECLMNCIDTLGDNNLIEVEFICCIRRVLSLPLKTPAVESLFKRLLPVMVKQIKSEQDFTKTYIIQYYNAIVGMISAKHQIQYLEFNKQTTITITNKPIWMLATDAIADLTSFLTKTKEGSYLIPKLYRILCLYFIQNTYQVDKLLKYYTPEMLKDYFEGERLLLDLITNELFPSSSLQQTDHILLCYVIYCNSMFTTDETQSKSSQISLDDLGVSFPRNSLLLLFKYASSETLNQDSSLSLLFLPFLLNRCRITFEQYSRESKLSVGSVAWNQTKRKDVDLILQLLKTLYIHPNSFTNIISSVKPDLNNYISNYSATKDQDLFPELPYEITKNPSSQALNTEHGHLVYLLPAIRSSTDTQVNQFDSSLNAIYSRIYAVLGVNQYYS